MADFYYTIEKPSEGFYKEKGSKFIAKAYPVKTEEEIKEVLQKLRTEYYDARHHCYAYILGKNGEKYRANDDGEPNHSAGDPILGQINSKELTNVIVVVIRYFGGTKLGVSGLINAYKTAAQYALTSAKIIKKFVTSTIKIDTNYNDLPSILSFISNFDCLITNENYLNQSIELCIEIKDKDIKELKDVFEPLYKSKYIKIE